VKVRVSRRKAIKGGENGIPVTLIEGLRLKIESSQPTTDAPSFDSQFLSSEKQSPAKSVTSGFRGDPQAFNQKPRPHRGAIEARKHSLLLVSDCKCDPLPVSGSHFCGVSTSNTSADRGEDRIKIRISIDGFVHAGIVFAERQR